MTMGGCDGMEDRADLKSVGFSRGGSNPSIRTKDFPEASVAELVDAIG